MSDITTMAVLGCGNMAAPLVTEFCQYDKQLQCHTFTPSQVRAKRLAQQANGLWHDALELIPPCDYYLIACKPQQLDTLVDQLAPQLPSNAVIISILAGKQVTALQKAFQTQCIIRLMPNTPVTVKQAVHALYFDASIPQQQQSYITNLCHSSGAVYVFNKESELDTITPYIGSGPAYIFEIAAILIDDLTHQGIDRHRAKAMVTDMIKGAAELMNKSDDSPDILRNNVTSKGGVTATVLNTLKEHNLEKIFHEALQKGLKKNAKLNDC